MKFLILTIFALGFFAGVVAQTPVSVSGYVFEDINKNQIKDKNEAGIKGVLISDQVRVTVTDEQGFYTLNIDGITGLIVVSQPNGYLVAGPFWKQVPAGVPSFAADFALMKAPPSAKFTFIHASDPHLNAESMVRFHKLKMLADSVKPAFIIITGDLIKDALRVPESVASPLYRLYVNELKKFSMPVWNVPGNHEIFGIERNLSGVSMDHPLYGKKMYRHFLGPDYYSFNYGGLHFMGLNSVDFHDMLYYGHIDSVQMAWIKNDLEVIGATTPVVTYNHIPFFSAGFTLREYSEAEPGSTLVSIAGKKSYRHIVGNAHEVITHLQSRNFTHALSGHHHLYQELVFKTDGRPIQFNQAAAVIGTGGSLGSSTLKSGVTVYKVVNGEIVSWQFVELR